MAEPKSWEQICEPYNDAFENKYSLKLFDLTFTIINGFKESRRSGTVHSSYRELIKRFRSDSVPRSITEKAIRLFELNSESLRLYWKYYQIHEVGVGVARQPIIRISGNKGRDGSVIYGPNTLMYALGLLMADLSRGIIDLGDFSQKHLAQKGPVFEDRIRTLLQDYSLTVLHYGNTPNAIGDIDCLAYYPPKGILFNIEAKSPKMDLNPKATSWQLERAKKWCAQLSRKSEWLKQNLPEVAKNLGFDVLKLKEIRNYVVVEVPIYCEKELEQTIITIEDLFFILEGFKQDIHS